MPGLRSRVCGGVHEAQFTISNLRMSAVDSRDSSARPRAYGGVARATWISVGAAAALLGILISEAEAWPRIGALLRNAKYLDQQGVVRQQNADDCGVAVLEMVLSNAPGLKATLDSARALVQARRRGLSFAEMRAIVNAHGGRARGMQMSLSALSRIPMPIIAQWPDHFVVVDLVDGSGQLTLRDPAFGRMRMTETAFSVLWTGRVLEVLAPEPRAP